MVTGRSESLYSYAAGLGQTLKASYQRTFRPPLGLFWLPPSVGIQPPPPPPPPAPYEVLYEVS